MTLFSCTMLNNLFDRNLIEQSMKGDAPRMTTVKMLPIRVRQGGMFFGMGIGALAAS